MVFILTLNSIIIAETESCSLLPGAYEPPRWKERLTSVPILCRITLQNVPYNDYKLFVLMSFEVTTVTSMDSQEPACSDDGHLLGFLTK